jgi:hypothetical protein
MQGRTTDPADPVYIPLDGMGKSGLLERDINSKPANVRRVMNAGASRDADYHVAVQAEEVCVCVCMYIWHFSCAVSSVCMTVRCALWPCVV